MIQRKQLTPQFIRVKERIAKIAHIKAHADDCQGCNGLGYKGAPAWGGLPQVGCSPCSFCNGTGKKHDYSAFRNVKLDQACIDAIGKFKESHAI